MGCQLFITCLADVFHPEIGEAMVEVLERTGVAVTFPHEQTCCGQPAFNTGNWNEAHAVALHMLDVFEGDDYVVCPSASCTGMVRQQYPVLFADDPRNLERAHRLAKRTFEFIEFLVKVLWITDWKAYYEGTLTYHYTCHLREIGITSEAEDLIRMLDRARYAPLENKDRCCGFGGAFSIKEPEVSGEMVRDKVRCIMDTGADAVVVNDTGCIMNIEGGLRRAGSDMPVIHLARILSGEVTGP